MTVTQHPAEIHTIFNPCIIKTSQQEGDEKAVIKISFGYDDHVTEFVTIEHEFFNFQAVIDIRSTLKSALIKRITELDDSPCWIDELLRIHYMVWTYEGDLIYQATAINAVVQVGESSDLTSRQGKFLTNATSVKKYTGYPNQLTFLGFKDENTLLKFDNAYVYNNRVDVLNAYVPSNINAVSLHKSIIPDFYNFFNNNWIFNLNGSFSCNNNNYEEIRTKDITPSGDQTYKCKFNAVLENLGTYKIEVFTTGTTFLQDLVDGENEFIFTVAGSHDFFIKIYGINDSSGECTVSDFTLIEATPSQTINCIAKTLPENPFFVRWLNQQGGYDEFMFGYRQFTQQALENIETYNPVVDDQQTASGFEELINLSATEIVRFGAQGLTANEYQMIRKMVYSPSVEVYNPLTSSWNKLIVTQGNSENDNRNILSEIEFSFKLPTPQLQF